MDEEALREIGTIIGVKYKFPFKKITTEELIETYEFKEFENKYPKLCKLAKED